MMGCRLFSCILEIIVGDEAETKLNMKSIPIQMTHNNTCPLSVLMELPQALLSIAQSFRNVHQQPHTTLLHLQIDLCHPSPCVLTNPCSLSPSTTALDHLNTEDRLGPSAKCVRAVLQLRLPATCCHPYKAPSSHFPTVRTSHP